MQVESPSGTEFLKFFNKFLRIFNKCMVLRVFVGSGDCGCKKV